MTDQPTPPPTGPDASVRRARPDDAAAMAGLTLASWRAQADGLLPEAALDSDALDAVRREWHEAIVVPPSRQHLVLVALDADEVVGYALAVPSQDPDTSGLGQVGELVDLVVREDRTRLGHASRLLAAVVDTLRGTGVNELRTWVTVGDDARLSFLAAAGLAPDGASRTLGDGPGAAELRQVRWAARID